MPDPFNASSRAMRTPAAFEATGKPPRDAKKFALRFWAIRHSAAMERIYDGVEWTLVKLSPLFTAIGWERLEKPVAKVEKLVKSSLFDCKMCGQCALSSTGMSCPMNCPKGLRNGPCGGVRANGNCEVYADMPCVWVKAYEGSRNMAAGNAIEMPQGPVDHRLKGQSSWLSVAREKSGYNARIAAEKAAAAAAAKAKAAAAKSTAAATGGGKP
ncbi:methylenetetrahydrofolate reductase C-terminal domain-containing protein [Labrys neptuniae]|uniref:methylenetetrahydrofolate reductase C-terminal domain-containing protein n=1 Tax=Labrys TaxID=204476 RepID=UPI0035DD1A39